MILLFLTPQLPYPPHQGTTIRNYNLIKGLAQRHEIHLLSFTHQQNESGALASLQEQCHRVATIAAPQGRSPAQRLASAFSSPLPDIALRLSSHKFEVKLDEWLTDGDFDVIQVEGLEMARYALQALQKRTQMDGGPLLVFDDHNAEYKLQQRAFRTDIFAPRRWIAAVYSLIQWRKLQRYEALICRACDRIIAVSSKDAEALKRLGGEFDVTVVPNGVDLDYYRPNTISPTEQRPSLVFTGKMDFRPNVDAVLWFCQEILPRVRKHSPTVHFSIVGRNPNSTVRRLKREPSVEVTGYVDDVRPYIAGATAYVAPLRMGSGTRLKVLEAMAMEKAIVATPLACEGLQIESGREVLLAEEAHEFAERILELLDDPQQRETLGRRGRKLVEERYGWGTIAPRLEAVYQIARI